ncbi:hypothetical protein [Nonomuraea sp. NPDC049625]|uniref:hypothetical protein n=1 Tax=Nonomuraea sp. NPDC049625 TaxID=3155775 RepID=UPI00342D2856
MVTRKMSWYAAKSASCLPARSAARAPRSASLESVRAVSKVATAAEPVEAGAVAGAEVEVEGGLGGEHGQVRLLRDVTQADHG